MKPCLLPWLAILIVAATQAADPPPYAVTPDDPPLLALDVSTLPADAQEALKSLKVGMTRKEVEQHFAADGGLSSSTSERYILLGVSAPGHPGLVVMVAISFQPSTMDDATFADVKRRGEWFRQHDWFSGDDPNAIVRSVSRPHASRVHLD